MSNVKIIVAVEPSGGFGYQGKLPWYYKEDFAFFKQQTMGHVCVMGRHTYEEINEKLGYRAKDSVLPGRRCYVVSNKVQHLPNAIVIHSLSAIREDEYFVIGGKMLFNEALIHTRNIYLIQINKHYPFDVTLDMKYINQNFHTHTVFPSTNDELTFSLLTRNQ